MAEIKQLNGRERRAMEHLIAFISYTAADPESLKERLKTIPNGWRDWRLMNAMSMKLYPALLNTLTDSQYAQFKKLEKYGTCMIQVQAAAKGEDFDFVRMSALKKIIQVAVEEHCSLCVKNDAECRGCKLRKAFMEICPLYEVPKHGCGYRELEREDLE